MVIHIYIYIRTLVVELNYLIFNSLIHNTPKEQGIKPKEQGIKS